MGNANQERRSTKQKERDDKPPTSSRPGWEPDDRPAAHTRTAIDEKVLSRIRALLAKAESSTFPAEAETFTAGAQALM
ncbi:MAG: DUF2786 domain-containing protein, partial [Actinomycetota bacterium]